MGQGPISQTNNLPIIQILKHSRCFYLLNDNLSVQTFTHVTRVCDQFRNVLIIIKPFAKCVPVMKDGQLPHLELLARMTYYRPESVWQDTGSRWSELWLYFLSLSFMHSIYSLVGMFSNDPVASEHGVSFLRGWAAMKDQVTLWCCLVWYRVYY